jgi:hypothetical protein
MRRLVGSVVLVLSGLAAVGCTHALSRPMPDIKGRLALKVSNEKVWEHPTGVYQIPDTSVYISGHQGAAPAVGALFGIIGVVAAHAAAKGTGEKKIKDVEAQLRLDIVAIAERMLAEEVQRQPDTNRFRPTGSPADGSLEITPYLVMNFIGENQVRPWVVLKTTLKDGRGDAKWKTRFIAGASEARPLGGESGWATGNGDKLRKAVDRNLRVAIDALLREASGRLPRGTGRTVTVTAQWVWIKSPMETKAEVLEETEETLVVVPDVTDASVFAGVNILDKKSIIVVAEPK